MPFWAVHLLFYPFLLENVFPTTVSVVKLGGWSPGTWPQLWAMKKPDSFLLYVSTVMSTVKTPLLIPAALNLKVTIQEENNGGHYLSSKRVTRHFLLEVYGCASSEMPQILTPSKTWFFNLLSPRIPIKAFLYKLARPVIKTWFPRC